MKVQIEEDRTLNLLELVIKSGNHPDHDKIQRFIRRGATLHHRHTHDGQIVEFKLAFGPHADKLATKLASRYDTEPEFATDQERGEHILLTRTPTNVLIEPPQG